MPGAIAPQLDRELQAWTRRVQNFAHEHFTEDLRKLRVRLEDKEAIAALHWRGVPDEEEAQAAIEDVAAAAERAGFTSHWGRKVLEIRPPVRIDKGAGIINLLRDRDLAAALYVGDDTTDLDAFRGLTELVEARSPRDRRAGRRAVRGRSLGARARGGHHGRRHRRRARAAPGAARLTAGALRRLPQGDGPPERRHRDAARRRHRDRPLARRRPGAAGVQRRLVDRRGAGRDLARPPRRRLAPDRAAAGLRARPDDAAGAAAGHDDRQPAVAAAPLRGRVLRARRVPAAGGGGRRRRGAHLGARMAAPGARRAGDRAARRRALLRRPHLPVPADPPGPHARLRRRLPPPAAVKGVRPPVRGRSALYYHRGV